MHGLQHTAPLSSKNSLAILINTLQWVGLDTNTKRTVAMKGTPSEIRVELPTEWYKKMNDGLNTAVHGTPERRHVKNIEAKCM